MSNKCRAYSESKLGLEPPDNRKAFYAGWDAALRAALAEPTVKESLQVEPAIAETATTQQQVEQTPPSEYRRGYWAGFEIGKREGRIEAEDALAESVQEYASIPGTNVRVPIRRKG